MGQSYWLKHPSTSDINVWHVSKFLLRDCNEVLEVGPFCDVAFGEDDPFCGLHVLFGFLREAEVRDDALGSMGGGETGEGEIDT